MPKMKTRKAAAKRFSATATGRFKRKRAGLRHNLECKSHQRKKRAVKTDYVSDANQAQIERMLPYA
ncbi:MAG: 50S ribosomal protein L35 [Bdellovibrionales bacterium]|jgi:large subunit ribosomal protein L35|nr:50S ribosomal protein L35 [Alphaproteobacteria bacterium]MBT6324999.1 50S ribosomal protein L35 [Bdellovibrionales bacterium]